MPISAPSIYPSGLFDKLDELELELIEHDGMVTAGVASVGPASSYALVWEYGNLRQTKQGPKTVFGTNPDGERVWLSSQAPFGYVRINTPQYWDIIEEEMAKVTFASTSAADITEELSRAAFRAVAKIAEIIREAAPEDSGELKDSITAIEPGDPDLDDIDADDTAVLQLDTGME